MIPTSGPVHNHGPHEGPGLDCPERIINPSGTIRGKCMEEEALARVLEEGPETITAEAERLVFGDRQAMYEHPRVAFGRIADIWNALLGDRLTEPLTPRDIALLMTGMKLAREAVKPKRDNRVDLAGYALCLDRLETEDDD